MNPISSFIGIFFRKRNLDNNKDENEKVENAKKRARNSHVNDNNNNNDDNDDLEVDDDLDVDDDDNDNLDVDDDDDLDVDNDDDENIDDNEGEDEDTIIDSETTPESGTNIRCEKRCTCIVCLESKKEADLAQIPCENSHTESLCHKCRSMLDICPLCRGKLETLLPIPIQNDGESMNKYLDRIWATRSDVITKATLTFIDISSSKEIILELHGNISVNLYNIYKGGSTFFIGIKCCNSSNGSNGSINDSYANFVNGSIRIHKLILIKKEKTLVVDSYRDSYRESNGCFTGNTPLYLWLPDETINEINFENVSKGDYVLTENGPKRIKNILKFHVNGVIWTILDGKISGSKYHPIFYKYENKWIFIHQHPDVKEQQFNGYLYNLQFDEGACSGYCLDKDLGIYGASIGHGFTDSTQDPVIGHSYFGNYVETDKDISELPFDDDGRRIAGGFKRGGKDCRVIGILPP